MDIQNFTPEQLAKIQALNKFGSHELSPEDVEALNKYLPTDNTYYIGDKGQQLQTAQNTNQYNADMAKIMANRLARQTKENPEHLDELYNSMKLRQEALDRIK